MLFKVIVEATPMVIAEQCVHGHRGSNGHGRLGPVFMVIMETMVMIIMDIIVMVIPEQW
jgi:hypothetical protein